MLFIIQFGFSQEHTENGWKYSITGKLMKKPKHLCECQTLIVHSQVFEFKILDSNFKNYVSKRINIVFPCPESVESFLKKGKLLKIEFYSDNSDLNIDDVICDQFLPKRKRVRRRFWAHSIKDLEANNSFVLFSDME